MKVNKTRKKSSKLEGQAHHANKTNKTEESEKEDVTDGTFKEGEYYEEHL